MATNINIELFRGEAKSLNFTVYDSSGGVETITGWSMAFYVRKTFDSGVVISKATGGSGITITSGAGGTLTVALAEEDTTLDVGGYRCTLARTDEGSETVLADGTFRVRGNTVLPA